MQNQRLRHHLGAAGCREKMRVHIESEWLEKNLHRWHGAITITTQIVFET